MMPEAHFVFSIIIWKLLYEFGIVPDYLSMLIILGIGVGIDVDVLFVTPHRTSFFHYPLTWILIGLFSSIFSIRYAYMVIAASIGHFILDSIDWSVYWLAPFSMRSFGLRIQEKNSQLDPYSDRLMNFIKEYYKDKRMIILEVALIIIALIICVI